METTQIQEKIGKVAEMSAIPAVFDVSAELERMVAEEDAKQRVLTAVVKKQDIEEQGKKERLSTIRNKELFLEYYAQLFHPEACWTKVGISERTYYRWMDEDSHFRAKFYEIKQRMGNMVENKLVALIQKGDGPSIRFWLEKNHPDYTPRSELTVIPGGTDDFTEMLWREARKRWEAKNGIKVVDGEVVEPKKLNDGHQQ